MSRDGVLLQPAVARYLTETAVTEPPLLRAIRTAHGTRNDMHAARATTDVLRWLVKLLNVRHYLEIGVFTGYSSTALALALPENGTVTACDISVTHTAQAQAAWRQAGIAGKVTLHLQPALITLSQLAQQGKADFFDMALIDADKLPTAHYVDACYPLLRTGGVIAIDNVLLNGRVADETRDSPSLRAMRDFNRAIVHDVRFEPLTLPVGDGLTLLCKKS